MSEKAPRSNPRLDNFDENKAVHDQAAFEKAVYGNAGTTLFNDRARRRVEEGDAYERHLEAMADRGNGDPFLADLNGQPSPAYEQEWDDAIAENEAFDARRANEEQAIVEKMTNDPEVRRMQMLADDIAKLRNRTFDHTNADALVDRLKDKEDKLNELLVKYSERDDADPVVIDRIIDSTATVPAQDTTTAADSGERADADAQTEAREGGHDDAEPRSDDETDQGEADDREADAADAVDVPNRPEVDTSWVDEATPAADTRPEVNTDWIDDNAPEGRPEVDTDWADGTRHDEDTGLDIVDGHEEAEGERERFSWLRHPFLRAGMLYQNGRERLRFRNSQEREGKRSTRAMVAVAAGTMAVAGAVIAWRLGAFDHLFGHHGSTGTHPGTGGNGGHGGTGGNGGAGGAGGTGGGNGGAGANPEFSPAAYNVHAGEGWYETFQDMNIPHDEWASLAQKVGPQLHEHGWAYVIENGPYKGQWGISQPGQLPKEMLELIQNAANEIAAAQ